MSGEAANLMVDVGVRLGALESGLARADQRISQFASKASGHVGKMESAFLRAGRNIVAYGVGGGVIAGIASMGRAAMSLEQNLANLAAVSGASGKQMQGFKQMAVDASQKTRYSAAQAADAMTQLAYGGVQLNQIGPALKGTLALATAGQLDVADAANAAANAMNLFGLKGKDVTHIADGFATAANSTTADIHDFVLALQAGGSVAKTAGYSFDQTMTVLEALSKAGVKNSDAGTSMKTAFIQLLAPTKRAREEMSKYGLSFIDANGHMKDSVAIADMFHAKLGKLTDAQRLAVFAQLAGTDGVRTLNSLYAAGGKTLAGYEDQLKKSGSAQRQADGMNDTTIVKLQKLGHSVQDAGIILADQFLPSLAAGASGAAKFIDGLGKDGQLQSFAQHAGQVAHEGIGAIGTAAQAAQGPVTALVGVLKGINSSVGVGPILATATAFKALQVGAGGASAIGGFAGGIMKAGAAAEGSGGKLATFGRGLMSTVGSANLAFAGVALLAGGIYYLSQQESAAEEAGRKMAAGLNEIGNAFQSVKDAGTSARQADLDLAQANLNVKTSSNAVAAAEKNVSDARAKYGKNSEQAREATLQYQQAVLILKRALLDQGIALDRDREAHHGVTDAQARAKQATKDLSDVIDAGAAAAEKAGVHNTILARGLVVGAAVTHDARKAANQYADALDNAASRASKAPGPVRDLTHIIATYVRTTGTIPDRKLTTIALQDAASGRISNIIALLSRIRDKRVLVSVYEAVTLPATGRPAPAGRRAHGQTSGYGSGRVTGGIHGDVIHALISPEEDIVNPYEKRLMRAGVPYDEAMRMGGAYQFAKGKSTQPRQPDDFLSNATRNQLARASSTLTDRDDRIAARHAVRELVRAVANRKRLHMTPQEWRDVEGAIGQYRQQALAPPKPTPSVDDLLGKAGAANTYAIAAARLTGTLVDDYAALTHRRTLLANLSHKKGLSLALRTDVANQLADLNGQISDLYGQMHPAPPDAGAGIGAPIDTSTADTSTPTDLGSSSAAATINNTNVTVYVAGSVAAAQDLAMTIRDNLLQYGKANGNIFGGYADNGRTAT